MMECNVLLIYGSKSTIFQSESRVLRTNEGFFLFFAVLIFFLYRYFRLIDLVYSEKFVHFCTHKD